jgi:long-chain acyl-CoA synthetase
LGIDSLEWLNLTVEIGRQAGVELNDEAIGRIETVRDLLREIVEQPQAGEGASGQNQVVDPLADPDRVLGDERTRWLAPWSVFETAAARFLYGLNWLLIHTLFRVQIEGREQVPAAGPFVVCSNHVSYLDSGVIAAALGFDVLRNTYWAGWSGIAFGPVFRMLRRWCHVVPIDPDRAAASSLAFGAAVLHDKHNLVWYPEGGHSKTGELEPLRPGIGLLLEHDPVPVVPVALFGTRAALPPGRYVPKSGPVRIRFGAPLDPRDLERRGHGKQPHERITDALHDALAKLQQAPSRPSSKPARRASA